jgi:hypothetical protein
MNTSSLFKKRKLWGISGDEHEALDGIEIEFDALSLDEPELEAIVFFDDGNRGNEIDTIHVF